jgi:hypothetical protein
MFTLRELELFANLVGASLQNLGDIKTESNEDVRFVSLLETELSSLLRKIKICLDNAFISQNDPQAGTWHLAYSKESGRYF